MLNAPGRENQREVVFTPQALNSLMNCYWPGNVRQLENCIERTATMARGNVIGEANLSCVQKKCLTQLLHAPEVPVHALSAPEKRATVIPTKDISETAPSEQLPTSERERLVWALEQCGWVQAKSARLLNISARQMGYALLKHGIEVKKF